MTPDTLPLIHAAQAGNRDAMALLLARYEPLIAATAARYSRFSGVYSARDDLAQDGRLAFMRAVHAFRAERPGACFPALVALAVKRGCERHLNRYRSPWSDCQHDWLPPTLEIPAGEPDPDAGMDGAFRALFLDQLVRTLPHRDRELIARTYGLGGRVACSAARAGKTLGMSASDASRRHRRALACLRGQISEEGP